MRVRFASRLPGSGSGRVISPLLVALLFLPCAALLGQASGNGGEPRDESGPAATASTSTGLSRMLARIERRGARSRMGDGITGLLRPAAEAYQASTVRICSGGDELAFGTVIDPAGLVLTSASTLRNPVEVELADGRRLPATVAGIDESTDLALLRVAAEGLVPAELVDRGAPGVGSWLMTLAPGAEPASLGVVSVAARRIPNSRSFIGITMEDATGGGVRLTSVVADSPADLANLQVNDVISAINSRPTPDSAALRAVLSEFEPGDRVELSVLRGDQVLQLNIELANADQFNQDSMRINQQERMGSRLSDRRSNFPQAFQHDSYLQANQMGGVLIDIDGQIAGINISRSGRVSTLALPMSVVVPSVQRLRSGELAPERVNRGRIEAISARLEALATEMAPLAGQLQSTEQELLAERARRDELERMYRELDTRIREIDARVESLQGSLAELSDRTARLQQQKELLERERQQLERGVK